MTIRDVIHRLSRANATRRGRRGRLQDASSPPCQGGDRGIEARRARAPLAAGESSPPEVGLTWAR